MYNCTTSRGPILISFLLDQSFFIIPPQSRKSVFSFWQGLWFRQQYLYPHAHRLKRVRTSFSQKKTHKSDHTTARKLINGFEAENTGPPWKRKSHLPNHHDFSFKLSIFRGFPKKTPTTGTGSRFRCVSTLSQGTWHVGVLGKSLQEVS